MNNQEGQEQQPSGTSGQEAPYGDHPTSEERKQQDDRKKWFWGCGGCLIAVILIVTVLGFLMVGVFTQLQQGSNEANQAIFGEAPPAGYITVGGKLPPGSGVNNVVLLINKDKQTQMMVAFDTPLSEHQARLLRTGGTPEMEQSIQRLMEGSLKGGPAEGSGLSVDNLHFDSFHTITLPNNKQYIITSAKIEDEGTYIPTVIGLLPHPGNRLVGLVAVDVATKSSDAEADFRGSYQALQNTIYSTVQGSGLQNSLAPVPAGE